MNDSTHPPVSLSWLVWGLGAAFYCFGFYQRVAPAVMTDRLMAEMAAYGAYVLERTLTLQREADLLAAMSLEALQGSAKPFDGRIHAIRPHRGQGVVASNIRRLLEGSEIMASHRDCF